MYVIRSQGRDFWVSVVGEKIFNFSWFFIYRNVFIELQYGGILLKFLFIEV